MRCKKHLPDLTSTVGVCASCLRERLQALLDAQAKAQAQAQAQSPRFASRAASDDHRRLGKPDPNPTPPPIFPRSVSPYVTRRRERLFHSMPQAGHGFSAACDGGTASTKRKLGRFWILSNMFRSRSNKTEDSSCEPSSSASPPSSTWLSTILPDCRQNHGLDRRRCRQSNRGASPAVTATENFGGEIDGRNRSASGCSSESSPQRQHQTTTVEARRSRLGPAGKSLASMALCLSPLVRASPTRHWNSHKGLAQELGVGGTHHLSNAAAFCANRSRKLADFGRVGHNR